MNAGLERHHQGDWGEHTDRDKLRNDEALERGSRLLSAYSTAQDLKFWIITEKDRTVTTILPPEDY